MPVKVFIYLNEYLPVEMYRCDKRFQLEETNLKNDSKSGELIMKEKKIMQISVCLPDIKKFRKSTYSNEFNVG